MPPDNFTTGLTAREAEVARLAGQGLTCREIAERLFLSTNTVKTHLRHAYEKCGARNRLEMARRMPPRRTTTVSRRA